MNWVANFEREAMGGRTFLKLSELELNKLFTIEQLRFIDSKWGRRVAVDLEGYIWTILPTRLSDMLKDQNALDEIIRKQYKMVYLGTDPKRMNMHLIRFCTGPVGEDEVDVSTTE